MKKLLMLFVTVLFVVGCSASKDEETGVDEKKAIEGAATTADDKAPVAQDETEPVRNDGFETGGCPYAKAHGNSGHGCKHGGRGPGDGGCPHAKAHGEGCPHAKAHENPEHECKCGGKGPKGEGCPHAKNAEDVVPTE